MRTETENKDLNKKENQDRGRAEEKDLSLCIREYYPEIFRYFYYRVEKRQDAEDLTSEVFVRVVGKERKKGGNVRAWFHCIARNLLVDYFRKHARTRQVSLASIDFEPSEILENNEERQLDSVALKKLLNILNNDQKEVVILRFIEGYTNKEVAERTGKSVSAVKSLQYRAIDNLRKKLKTEEER